MDTSPIADTMQGDLETSTNQAGGQARLALPRACPAQVTERGDEILGPGPGGVPRRTGMLKGEPEPNWWPAQKGAQQKDEVD